MSYHYVLRLTNVAPHPNRQVVRVPPEIPGNLKFEPRRQSFRVELRRSTSSRLELANVYSFPPRFSSSRDSGHEPRCIEKECGSDALWLENGRTGLQLQWSYVTLPHCFRWTLS